MRAHHKAELEAAQKGPIDDLPTDMRISMHEKICAIRYGVIDGRLTRIEIILLTSTASLITGMAVMLWELVKGHVGG